MRPVELFRSTPFRLAVAFSGLFVIAVFIAGLIAYEFVQDNLRERLDRNIKETFQFIAQSYGTGDIEDLIATVQSFSAATQKFDRVFYLADANGKQLAGNAGKAPLAAGLADASAVDLGVNAENAYRIFRGDVAGNTLIIAQSYGDTEELRAVALTSFFWAGGIAMVIALGAGIILAGAVGARLQSISNTMALVGQGNLKARISLSGHKDDVDAMATQINTALDRLAALVEGMRQVSMDIAHDLKTPLNRLSITVESAIEKAGRGEDISNDLMQAQEETQQINTTFDALLRIAQLEAGARRDRFGTVDISGVLDVLAEVYAEVARDGGHTLTYACALGPDDTIFGDRDLLTQMCANLIENAIRHGGDAAQIEIAAQRDGDQIAICVSDTGPGIPVAERSKVFQRLYRLEKSRTTLGTGLGLSLVKAIADLHHGVITLSDNHPGLRVRIAVPVSAHRPDA